MPGIDLFTRRRVRLSRHWLKGPRRFLDAGSGNGWFSRLAYRSGATVTAVNIADDQVRRSVQFYNGWLRIPASCLRFKTLDLYDLERLRPGFDEIICYETLEHIRDDVRVSRSFHRLLRTGGCLHLCCPNAEHGRWRNEPVDPDEKGSHVRPGYTPASYRALLEPLGFKIVHTEGMGGPFLTGMTYLVQAVQKRWGDFWAIPVFLAGLPFAWLDPSRPACPYSWYVKAVKKAD